MKRIKQYAASVVLCAFVLSMASCAKDNVRFSKNTLRFSIEDNGTKTALDGYSLKWETMDTIFVTNSLYGTNYMLQSGSGTTEGTFACEEGTDVYGTHMYAFYPANVFSGFDGGTPAVYINPTQTYDANKKMKGFPMYAEFDMNEDGSTTEAHFKNLCGVLHLRLTQPGVTLSQIVITTNKRITGEFPVTEATENDNTVYRIDPVADDNQSTITLDCGNGVSIGNGTDFYIYLPGGDYSFFRITMTTPDGERCIFRTDGIASIHILRNHIHTIELEPDDLSFEIGLYSVSSSKQVYFAPGNVYYNTVTQTWGIFQDETERHVNGANPTYVLSSGVPNGIASTDHDPTTVTGDYIDYFRQGYGSYSTNPSTSMTNTSNLTVSGGNDWGALFPGEGWYTLTSTEWMYVIDGRTNETSPWHGFSAQDLRGYLNVIGDDGIARRCYVLLPDSCSKRVADFASAANEYTVSLTELDAYHACVLPWESYFNPSKDGWDGTKSCYWTATYTYFICTHNDWNTLHAKNEGNGQTLGFVRLAHDCPTNNTQSK